jgi:protein-S-isoprenylcysteine O-methyltransferase Ste14
MWLFGVVLRFLVMISLLGAVLFLSAGRTDIPAFWAYLAVFAAMIPIMCLAAGTELMRERVSPGEGGKDRATQVLALPITVVHFVIAGLDVGRFHFSDTVPRWLQICAFVGLLAILAMWARAMRENRFFSSVIRIQRDRGHRVVDTGPYRVVRHPGYAAAATMLLWSGVALGSWWSMAPGVLMTLLFLRRTMLEDRTLHNELEGYREYAERVRYRLLPGVW